MNYLKRDYLFLFVWLVMFLTLEGEIGAKFGLQNIFLTPEYQGHIGIMAFLLSGLGVGSFIMAFNVSAYVISAHRYPYLATVARPFLIFTINNFFIPFLYILIYIYKSLLHQIFYEFISPVEAIENILLFLVGIALFVVFSFGYFYFITQILPKIIKINTEKIKTKKFWYLILKRYLKDKEKKLKEAPEENIGDEKVEFYLGSNLKIKYSRKYGHYDKEFLTKTFSNQHLHALFFVILVLLLIFIRGLLKDSPALIIPAAASIHVIFTVILLTASLFYIFYAEWSLFFFILILGILGFINPFLTEKYTHSAYGLNYELKNKYVNPLEHGNYTADSLEIINILNKWEQTQVNKTGKKPKIILITTSGGGMKQAVWTYFAISYADSLVNGKLLENTRLITGASGGMLGATYLRENYLQQKLGIIQNYRDTKFIKNLSKDILNPVLYGLSMSDIFPHYKTFKFKDKYYIKDRAYLFEQAVNWHTSYALQKPLCYYRKYEQQAEIPMVILTPSIMNVGTRLIISPLDVSFLTQNQVKKNVRSIEFRYNYKDFDADSLNFLTAVRMNASFPYVTPFVTMPGKTKIRIFDAGLTDNYGFLTAYDFLLEFKDWINENTSGVILINLCENEIVNYNDKSSAFYKLLEPVLSLFSTWDIVQNYNNYSAISSLKKVFPHKFDIINLTFGNKKHEVSLSWHLTAREKNFIFSEIKNQDNTKELQHLKELLM